MRTAMRRSSFLVLGLVALGAFAAVLSPAGCAGGVACQLNSDCPFGYCQSGTCQKNCVDASRDCPTGYICDQNAQCVPPGGTGGSASSSTASVTGTGGAGPSSSTGSGAGPTSSSSAGPSSSSGAGAATSSSSSSTTTTTSSTAASSSGATMNKHELDLCTSDGDCASPLVCRAMTPGGAQRCTHACTSDAGCTTVGTRCNLSALYCADDDTGRACTVATTCNFGCLTSQQYCTNNCTTGADCPNGYGCMVVSNQRICVKAEAPCDATDASACIAPAACDTSAQMVVSGCTLVCASASDCPQRAAGFAPWSCDTGGICRRPPDVFGPLQNGATPAQYACDPNEADAVVNVCNDDQHIDYQAFDFPMAPVVSCTATMTTAGIATDSCVDSCRYQGSLPRSGSHVVGVGSVGSSRIGLCLPTGGGEVGASCTHDSDCVFGYCPSALGKCSRDCTGDGVCPGGTTCTAAGGPPVEGAPFRRCQ